MLPCRTRAALVFTTHGPARAIHPLPIRIRHWVCALGDKTISRAYRIRPARKLASRAQDYAAHRQGVFQPTGIPTTSFSN
jgi:hypothetical protein